MKAIFIESTNFSERLPDYLTEDEYRELQNLLLKNPKQGSVIQGTGGLRKVRYSEGNRGKGSRGGVRIIYYWWENRSNFYMATIYSKGEVSDLTTQQKKALKGLIEGWKNEY